MKYLFISLAAMMCMLGVISCGSSSMDTPEQLAEAVVSSLQDNDLEAYLRLCGTTDDRIYWLKNLPSTEVNQEQVAELIAELEETRDHTDEKGRGLRTENFYLFSQDRIWQNAEIIRLVSEPNGTNAISVRVEFRGHKPLQISGILKVRDGWRILGGRPLEWD